MNNLKIFISLLTIFLFFSCEKDHFDQGVKQPLTTNKSETKRCNTDAHMKELMRNADYARIHRMKYDAVAQFNSIRGGCSTPTIIPIAIHYQNVSSPDKACLIKLAKSQIKVLNDDIQGKNTDISTWTNNASRHLPGIVNGEACLEFCIANQNHPSGYGLSNGTVAVTFNQTSGDDLPKWSGYLNIIVRPNIGALGYSPLGGLGNGDAVVINANAFGTGTGCGQVSPEQPYVLGRTATHEVGHYLLMDHIWGEGCGIDDGIGDTPNSREEYYGCPGLGLKSCGSNDLHMNYMDYTDDNCMYMFTAGQASTMERYVGSSLQNLVTKGKTVCSGNEGPGETKGIDAGVIRLVSPSGTICARTISPKVKVKNFGPKKMTQVEIHYGIDGDFTKIHHWSGSLTVGKSILVALPAMVISSGNQTFDAETKMPNKLVDIKSSNNKKSKSFNAIGGSQYSLTIKPDDWGGDITWKLLDENYQVVSKGGPYPDFDRRVIRKSFCLEDGCYTFKMYDSWGDGICCDYGYGKYNLKDASGNVIFSSNGRYGSRETKYFCTSNGSYQLKDSSRDEKAEGQLFRVRK